jgi:hypothetical protein
MGHARPPPDGPSVSGQYEVQIKCMASFRLKEILEEKNIEIA